MKNRLKFIVVSFFLLIFYNSLNVKAQITYKNEQKDYSFSVPADWVEIPKDLINQRLVELNKLVENKNKINFVTGFQLKNQPYFEQPYLLVQEHETDSPSFKQLEEFFKSDKYQDQLQKVQGELSEILSNSKFDKPILDKEKNRIYINIQMELQDGSKVKGIAIIILGKKSITQLNFYSSEAEFEKWIPVFENISNSFEYGESNQYKNSSSNGNFLNGFLLNNLYTLIIGEYYLEHF